MTLWPIQSPTLDPRNSLWLSGCLAKAYTIMPNQPSKWCISSHLTGFWNQSKIYFIFFILWFQAIDCDWKKIDSKIAISHNANIISKIWNHFLPFNVDLKNDWNMANEQNNGTKMKSRVIARVFDRSTHQWVMSKRSIPYSECPNVDDRMNDRFSK